ncbi:hypothetical protein AB4Z45_12575 [Paenibacillus sp. MCAF9]|uniref:hypothetical protein n=1 Tax=Paenibacillus sp. MCAF9 TaxID=3233046 RepID=UPI003F95BB6C
MKPKFNDYSNEGPDFYPKHAPFQQKGAGGHTLCGYCNNKTGSWYADEYVNFAHQAAVLLNKSKGELTLQYPYYIFPLRLIKQVIAMICSVNKPGFAIRNKELVQFILNKEQKYINPKFKIYAYLTTSKLSRQSGESYVFKGSRISHFSEIGFAPLGFIMTYNTLPPNNKLLDISHFSHYDYDDFDVAFLKLNVLPVSYYLPGDFRTRDEILIDYEKNIRDAKESFNV